MGFKDLIERNLSNLRGFKTKRKLIIIESDDWGSIRMPSESIYLKLKEKGYNIEKFPYCFNDALASEEDLSALFELISSFKDKNGQNPKITANTVVANPDFEKIEQNGFANYFYEPFTDTLKKYPKHLKAFDIWKEGIDNNIFIPQFHGREHLNVNIWMKALQTSNPLFKELFNYRMWGLAGSHALVNGINIQAAFDTNSKEALHDQKHILKEGLQLFKDIFGYSAESFVPNNYIYHPDLNNILNKAGVKFIYGIRKQRYPLLGNKKRQSIRHFIGEKNNLNQYFLVRNCEFEPTLKPNHFDNIDNCLKGIQNAFFWNRPAIISSHRWNYIGYINRKNRENNLQYLNKLLSEILRIWPDVEFLSSAELGNYIASNRN